MKFLKDWLFAQPRVASGDIFAALDIGSSKIACLIARSEHDGPPRVVGIGHQLSEGMRQGGVSNMEALQYAVGQAVSAAEQMAGENIQRVTVNISGAHLASQTVDIELPLNGREVIENDIARIAAQGQTMAPEDQHSQPLELLHTIPVSYALDGQKGIRDPLGMTGVSLHAQMHLIAAGFGPVRTLATAIARCHLDVDQIVAAPYASGLACLVEDEMDLGSLVVDMGAGTTGYAVFFDGNIVFAGGIAMGGAHVTSDIARGLTTSVANAERLKTLYGNAIQSPMDERESIDVPLVGEEAPENANHLPKSHLIRIIQPRIEETFEILRARMDKSGFNEIAGRRVVLTGGASQLPGVRELAQRMLDKQVRLGRPLRVARPSTLSSRSGGTSFTGLAESTSGPAFATTAGLLAIAMQPELASSAGASTFTNRALGSGGSALNRIGLWLKQSL
jgi:cell division protein FtsA